MSATSQSTLAKCMIFIEWQSIYLCLKHSTHKRKSERIRTTNQSGEFVRCKMCPTNGNRDRSHTSLRKDISFEFMHKHPYTESRVQIEKKCFKRLLSSTHSAFTFTVMPLISNWVVKEERVRKKNNQKSHNNLERRNGAEFQTIKAIRHGVFDVILLRRVYEALNLRVLMLIAHWHYPVWTRLGECGRGWRERGEYISYIYRTHETLNCNHVG